jgi:5-methyltetrahydrofolate--homocysteine methyltransferase
MKNLLERLKNGETLVADGALGTMLMERGLKPGEPPESFNLTRLQVLEEIARLYFNAGADIISTNTFGASPLKLSFYSLEDKIKEINRNAILAVRKVVDDHAYVAASCGPSGRILKPYGDTEPEDVYKSFEKQMCILVDSGIDIICIETMIDLNEAILAIKAAKNVSRTTPVISTMTFDPTSGGFYTVMGTNIQDAVKGLEKAGADIIGSNCGNGIENMIKIAKDFKQYSTVPLIIQSNAGIPRLQGDKTVYPETPKFMAKKTKELLAIGVSIIGGCCGTTPEHIREIKHMTDSYVKSH